jgi:diaminopimelate decarboxylase
MKKLKFERPIITKLHHGFINKVGMKSEFEPITHIDGIRVSDLLEKYNSPLFVISEKKIIETYKEAYKSFSTRYPKVQFAWSYKTNYLNAVCNVFHQQGAWAEVVSRFEYDKAISNGVNGRNIIFNGPDKSEDDLRVAIQNDSLIHIDHFDELYILLEIAEGLDKKPRVAIRINMDVGIYPLWDRFGFNYENGEAWEAINRILLSNKLDLCGLHTHIGTFILSTDAYTIAAGKLSDLIVGIKNKYKKNIEYLDIGGGFASKNTLRGAYLPGFDTAPTFDEYADAISSAIIRSQIEPDSLPLLILETGRSLIDDAGSLLGTVVANKRMSDGRRSLIMDFGVNLLFTSFWYEHNITPAQEFSKNIESVVIFGPLCMNIDKLRDSATLPPLKRGDKVVVSRIGAYNMTQWMQFINMRPKVVMIDETGKVHIIRENETLETLNSMERIPDHLKKINHT